VAGRKDRREDVRIASATAARFVASSWVERMEMVG
jgi:hypothetical protein